MDTCRKGNISQKALELELEKLGAYVYPGSGDGAKVDFLFTFNFEKFYRVQAKTAYCNRNRDGTIGIDAKGCTSKNGKIVFYNYKGLVDFIGAYYPKNNKCYLIPMPAVGKRNIKLRFSPTKNNQNIGINWAKDYEVENIVKNLRV